jgi:hypothetical protein
MLQTLYMVHAWYTDMCEGPNEQNAHAFFFTELEARNYVSELITSDKRFDDGAPFTTKIVQYEMVTK